MRRTRAQQKTIGDNCNKNALPSTRFRISKKKKVWHETKNSDGTKNEWGKRQKIRFFFLHASEISEFTRFQLCRVIVHVCFALCLGGFFCAIFVDETITTLIVWISSFIQLHSNSILKLWILLLLLLLLYC